MATISYSPSQYLSVAEPNWGTTNNNGRLQSVTVYAGGPSQLGNLPAYTTTFGYDNVNRLNAVSDSDYTGNFGYDPYGNMWVSGSTGIASAGPTSNIYNSANNRASTLGYDAAGNVATNGATAYTYDAENRETQAADAPGIGGGTVNYLFDGAGERVQKQIVGGVTTVYVYDAFGQLAAEYSSTANTSPCTTCYLSWDQLGTPRLVTDQHGNVVARGMIIFPSAKRSRPTKPDAAASGDRKAIP